MSPYLNSVRRLVSNGAKIEKYLRKIKESWKDPFSFMGIVSFILLVVFSGVFFLRSFSGNNMNLSYLKESFFSLTASQNLFSETLPQGHFLISANKFSTESPNFLIIEKNSLRAITPPVIVSGQVLGTIVADYEVENKETSISEYIVEEGDTLSSLAEKFNISIDTIRWANDLKNSKIRVGQKLVILPVSGVIHQVKSGDTVSQIAKTYKGKTEEIVAFNELAHENDIYIGDILIVPNGVMPAPSVKQITTSQAPISSAYFIAPTKGKISQGLHWHNAIDFSNSCGALVFASAQGTVQRVSYGWNNGYGNYLTILHPNGVVTLYAHLSQIAVSNGTNVSQGTIIGWVGNTGRTVGATGCHVHFEVRGAQNPFAGYRLGTSF